MKKILAVIQVSLVMLCSCAKEYDIIVVGGGAGGVSAGLQAARKGADVLLLCEHEWLGGMLTSAGVSAVDGNYNLRGGIFGEFTDSLAARYGGYEALRTGWVSNILFEPHVGAEVFDNMVSGQKGLEVRKRALFSGISRDAKGWTVAYTCGSECRNARCRVVIDATELGDAARAAGIPYSIGMDAREDTGESGAAESANDIIQDLTYVAVLKDYGPDADMTVPEPDGYDPSRYANSCRSSRSSDCPEKGQALWSPEMMISYGALPNGKYMINWPIEGNDWYLNVIDSSYAARERAYLAAKNQTLGFVYYIQTELGMRNLGLADDEFPTEDRLPMMPYNRESRRIKAAALLTIPAAEDPYTFRSPLYRTGIAVGDYAVDHHHFQHPDWQNLPRLLFARIQAFSVPLGCLVPESVDNFIVAEKSIGVSNLMNGTTRLQPVVMEIGQAAGEMAALAVKTLTPVRDIRVRDVQNGLLESGCYIMPYRDLPVSDPDFKAVQRTGASGLLHSEGFFADWQNKCFMRTDDPLLWNELYLEETYGIPYNASDAPVLCSELCRLIGEITGEDIVLSGSDHPLTRKEGMVLLDRYLDPFNSFSVDWQGNFVR